MVRCLLALLVAAAVVSVPNWNDPRFISVRDGINNNPASTWKAAIHSSIPYDNEEALRRLVGAKIPTIPPLPNTPQDDSADTETTARQAQSIPTAYDLRTDPLYKRCWSLTYVRNQFSCGSCFAVSTMSSLSDRFCIKSAKNATWAQQNALRGLGTQRSFSYEDLLECCIGKNSWGYSQCGYGSQGGCNGGDPYGAFDYAATTGVVTGENGGNFTNCKPYAWAVYPSGAVTAPACSTSCANSVLYKTSYMNDRYKINRANIISNRADSTATTVLKAQQAIMQNGSIVAAYNVYYDFYFYKSGVYISNQQSYLGGHAVKVIGWGVTTATATVPATPYWIAANSWGSGWGLSGHFWILRGQNHCNFEGYLTEGILN